MAHQFIRLPPDSTGKRVFNRVEVLLDYDAGGTDFTVGDIVVGGTSGVTGDIIKTEGVTASGTIHVLLDEDSTISFTDGEDLEIGGISYASADGVGTPYYVAASIIAGGNSTANVVEVDQYGSLQTKFSEGSPGLDAFGKLEVSAQTTIADYVYAYDNLPNTISESLGVSGTATYTGNGSHWIDMATTTLSGDSVIRTTDMYHLYQPGFSTVARTALWHGDTGKANNVRRWGYFDENDGVFFELIGTTLNVVWRSSATGSVIDEKIAQADWNKDTLDGDADRDNKSGITLDITKSQIYTFEMAFPADIVRFGIQYGGHHIIVHEHQHGNIEAYPLIGHNNLPMRWENVNTAATGGASNMYQIASTVKVSGPFEPEAAGYANDSGVTSVTTSASWTPVFSGRAKQTFLGADNRKIVTPTKMSIYNIGSAPIEVVILFNGTLTGDTWASDLGTFSAAIQDTTATVVAGGASITRVLMEGADVETIDITTQMATAEGKLFRKADITAAPNQMTLAVKLLEGTSGSTTVKAVMNWKEF